MCSWNRSKRSQVDLESSLFFVSSPPSRKSSTNQKHAPISCAGNIRTSERLLTGLEHSCSPRSNTSIKNRTASLNISNRQSCSRTLCSAQLRTALTHIWPGRAMSVAPKAPESLGGIWDAEPADVESCTSVEVARRGGGGGGGDMW